MASCRMLPHGVYSLFPAILTTIGWLVSLFQDGCNYSRLTGSMVEQMSQGSDAPYLEVGIAAYRIPEYDASRGTWETVFMGACATYPDSVPQDAYWNAAKWFDFLALVLGGAGTFFLWFSTCCIFSKGTWRWAGYEVLLAAIFQGLSFLWFKTAMCQAEGSHCDLFWGSKADIVAASVWAVAALSIFCYYPAPREERAGDGLWLQNPANATTQPAVHVSDGSLSMDEPTVTTAAAATMTDVPRRSDNNDDNAGGLETSSGQDSRQEGEERNKEKEMTDVELV